MNPHQRSKIDISTLSDEEQKLFRLYGKLPTRRDILNNKLKERKYFDSGDYALSKAGKASDVGVMGIGSQHPLPENIPHHVAAGSGTATGAGGGGAVAGSPVKEVHVKSPMGVVPPTEGEDDSDTEEADKATAASAAGVPIPPH